MFKKTIIAMSLIAGASTATAATLSGTNVHSAGITAVTNSIQEVATLDKVTLVKQFLHLDANYGAGDTITVTYSGASLDSNFTHPTGNLVTGITNAAAADAAAVAASCTGFSVSFAGLSGNVATYTVGASDGDNVDCYIELPPIDVDGASAASADTFSVAVSTSRGFGALETVAATKLIDVGAAEITAAIGTTCGDKAQATIDVNEGRKKFTDGCDAGDAVDTADTIKLVIADVAGGAELDGATSNVTLTGDFSWAKKTAADGTVTWPGVGVASVTAANTASVVVAADKVTWIAKDEDTYTVTLTPQTGGDAVVLPATSFSASVAMNYTNGTDAAVLTDTVVAAAGSWTLNGASITGYAMPNSAAVTPFVWLQNAGASDGDITGSFTCDGATTTIASLGTAVAKSNTRVGTLIQEAVDAAGTCSATSRYDFTVTVNAPAADITMNASYKVTAADGATDRLSLETSDSLN
jgi:hypothetical protein